MGRSRDTDDREGSAGLRAGVKAALMRWVLQKRRGLQTDPWPTAQDEATHAWDGRRRFAEDYTFAAVQDGLALLVRLEWLSGRDAHRLWVVVLRDHVGAAHGPNAAQRGTAWRLADGDALVPRGLGDRWRVGGIVLDCLRPHREWSLRYRGRVLEASADAHAQPVRCELDLSFTSELDPYVPGVDDDPELIARRLGEAQWDAELLRMVRRATQRGYVQIGRFAGTLALGDELVPIRADALRQHTWGVRDWGATRRAEQVFFAWPSGGAVPPGGAGPSGGAGPTGLRAWVHRAEFPAFTLEGGFLLDGSQATPVSAVALEPRAPEVGVPSSSVITVERSDSHSRIAIATETRAEVSFPVDGRGALSVGLVRTGDGGFGLWAAQRRTLPWPRAK